VMREEGNSEGHKVMMCNKNFYTIARQGDTFKSISKEMGVSERRLRKYNEVDRHYVLQEGDIVYFEKKQKRADKAYRGVYHRLKAGESLYSISQHFGMRLKTLYSINNLSSDYMPKVDDLILLRK
jgi:LysM repeat protein